VNSTRVVVPLALLAVLLPLLPARGDLLDRPPKQVLIDTLLLSVDRHREVELGIDFLKPKHRLDPSIAGDVRNRLQAARMYTQDAVGMIQADTDLSGTPTGTASTGLLNGALDLDDRILDALDGQPRAREISRPNVLALRNTVAAIEILKGHPITNRSLGGALRRRDAKQVGRFLDSADAFRDVLAGIGIDTSPFAGLFDGFDGGKKKEILARLDFPEIENLRLRPKRGDLQVRGAGRRPDNGSVVLTNLLPPEFTVILRTELPSRLSKKKRNALEGFAFGLEVASDRGSPPAQFGGFEVQLAPEGVAQSFSFANGQVLDVFPVALPNVSTRTVVTSYLVKDGQTVTLGGIFDYPDGGREQAESSVPVLGDLPILRSYFRNASRKTTVVQKTLMIFVSPHVIDTP